MPEIARAAAAKKLSDTEKRLYFNLGLTDVNGRIKDIPTLDMTPIFDTYLSDSGRPTIEHILSAIRDGDFELRQNVKLRVDTLINRQAITTRQRDVGPGSTPLKLPNIEGGEDSVDAESESLWVLCYDDYLIQVNSY
jgi:hypothetical protein